MKQISYKGHSLEEIPDLEETESYELNLDNNAIKVLDRIPQCCSLLNLANNKYIIF